MICHFCGAQTPEGAVKCPVCGSPLNQEKGVGAGTGQVRCTACGAALPAGTRFCPRCGTALGGPSPQEQARRSQEQDAFWQDVEQKAQKSAGTRRRSTVLSWIFRLVGLGIVAYLVHYVSS